jgi:hypothetical protein
LFGVRKGTICRNGPSGAAHKWFLTPFSPPMVRCETLRSILKVIYAKSPVGDHVRMPDAHVLFPGVSADVIGRETRCRLGIYKTIGLHHHKWFLTPSAVARISALLESWIDMSTIGVYRTRRFNM